MVDSALLRPGRLDKLLYVPLPDPAGRASILDTLVRRVPLAADVDVPSIGMSQHCEGFSGADLGALVRPLCASHSGRPSAQQLFQILSQALALLWCNI
jgi:ribosome biogenesis ATPase